jgi:hypothetical protein
MVTELTIVGESSGVLPPWIKLTSSALSIQIKDKSQEAKSYSLQLRAYLPQDPGLHEVVQTFSLVIQNPCNNGNSIVWKTPG